MDNTNCIGCTWYRRAENRCIIGVENPNECMDYETNDHYEDGCEYEV